MRRCYEELGRAPDAPLASLDDAFKPLDECVQYEHFHGEWVPHHFTLPPNPLTPGEPVPLHPWEMVRAAFAFIESERRKLPGADQRSLRERLSHAPVRSGLVLLHTHAARRAKRPGHAPRQLRAAAWLAGRVRSVAWRLLVRPRVEDKGVRLFFMWLDLAAAMLAGISPRRAPGARLRRGRRRGVPRLAGPSRGERADGRGLTDGARHLRRSILLRGGRHQPPQRRRGQGRTGPDPEPLHVQGRADVQDAGGHGRHRVRPLYEVLRRRGVRFEFFHCVTRLGTSADGGSVDEIDFVQQASVLGASYQPLVDVKGLPCWPSEPDWSQLADGEQLRALRVNLEQDTNPLAREPVTLRRSEDFDVAVLAIPVGALPAICSDLSAANERFAQMLERSDTVMTQAFQLWLTRDARELGFPYRPGTLASCFTEPLDTYCDMNQLLVREEWPTGDDVRQIAYFCGVLPHVGLDTQAQADERARTLALDYLEHSVQTIWPRSHAGGRFDWSLLVGADGASGAQALQTQYCRANFSATDRYALTLAGHVKDRLWPDQSGFENLFLAGDWTRNGIRRRAERGGGCHLRPARSARDQRIASGGGRHRGRVRVRPR